MAMREGGAMLRVSAIEVCRVWAAEIWRAERAHEHLALGGLNSEHAVRERLQKLAMELETDERVPDVLALQLIAIGWRTDDPLTILEKTEHMLALHRPGNYASIDHLTQGSGRAASLLARMLLVQCLGGRLGRWAVRTGEIPDARTARGLTRHLGEACWSQYRALLAASEELFRAGRYRDAAAALLDADRLVRTPAGLLRASVALTKAGDYISALWAARACLLEPKARFESAAAVLMAHKLEAQLRAIIEGRADVPLGKEEAELLIAGASASDRRQPPQQPHQPIQLLPPPPQPLQQSRQQPVRSPQPAQHQYDALPDAPQSPQQSRQQPVRSPPPAQHQIPAHQDAPWPQLHRPKPAQRPLPSVPLASQPPSIEPASIDLATVPRAERRAIRGPIPDLPIPRRYRVPPFRTRHNPALPARMRACTPGHSKSDQYAIATEIIVAAHVGATRSALSSDASEPTAPSRAVVMEPITRPIPTPARAKAPSRAVVIEPITRPISTPAPATAPPTPPRQRPSKTPARVSAQAFARIDLTKIPITTVEPATTRAEPFFADDLLQLVSETFDIGLSWTKEQIAAHFDLDSQMTEDEWIPISLDTQDSISIRIEVPKRLESEKELAADPGEPIEPDEPVEPVEPVKPVKPARPSDRARRRAEVLAELLPIPCEALTELVRPLGLHESQLLLPFERAIIEDAQANATNVITEQVRHRSASR